MHQCLPRLQLLSSRRPTPTHWPWRKQLPSASAKCITRPMNSGAPASSCAAWLHGSADLGAYIDVGLYVEGSSQGPLTGKTVAIKDLFDIAGQRTGFGHPLWQQTHPPAECTATAVQKLIDAGASIRGRTHMDELAYSLNGENMHYGTPFNPAAPGRIPGGSSSGSAVAVAAGHVDIGLGSDTGGSVRVPASYCGIFGFRPSHGRVSLAGARPLAPSFDTVGWFTRSLGLLQDVSTVLLDSQPSIHSSNSITQVLWPTDAWALAQPPTANALLQAVSDNRNSTGTNTPESLLSDVLQKLPAKMGLGSIVGTVNLGQGQMDGGSARLQEAGMQLRQLGLNQLSDWLDVFRITQAAEIWQEHGSWITQHQPQLGPGIKERFAMAAAITPEECKAAQAKRQCITAFLHLLLQPDEGALSGSRVLVLPSAPGPAPLCDTPAASLDDWRKRLISLTCIAGLAGLPQVSLPLATVDGLPVGLSLIGASGADEALLAAARTLVQNTRPELL